ncbi:MAG: hypothetical protein IJL67_11925 [Oscillospiraceae bacterium]|nr:hypothetical protein [Oscillospiraceae bacterium]MBQ5990190.1 hypothetical protein [Oscillospiraceae bacterium]
MKKLTKALVGAALALSLTAVPGINSIIPFAPSSSSIQTVSAGSVKYYKVTGDLVRLRKEPTINSTTLYLMRKNDLVYHNGLESREYRPGSYDYRWYRVKWNGVWGWACKSYLK